MMSAAAKLYERTEAMRIVDELLVETEGELTPEILALQFEAVQDFEEKALAVGAKVDELESFAAQCKAAATRMADRGKSAASQAASLRNYLAVQLQLAGIKDIKRPWLSVALRMNPPKVEQLVAEPSILDEWRAEWDLAGVLGEADPQLGLALDVLTPCVIVTPAQEIPESREWDKKALLELAKTAPDVAAKVATITRGIRVEVK